ncbi:LysR family transcriptional regulator [Frigidibacter sp. RF13]|nr:LysR family transcriptional regulator [Frigidibacter sp. RF13]
MRTFLAVVETGSVTRAADEIGRTQSAVSMQIRRLEETLGQALFVRLPRGVTLTAEGSQLVPHARRVIRSLEEAALALRAKPLDGPVRVGIPEEYSETVLPQALAAFASRHAGVEVTVRCDHSDPHIAALAADELDLAVIFEKVRSSEGELMCMDPTVWVTNDAFGQHLQRPLPVAAYSRPDWCNQYAFQSLERLAIDYRVVFACDPSGGLRTAVRTGLAVAFLTRSTIPEGCRELTSDDGFGMIDSTLTVLRRNPRGSTPAIDALAAMLRDAFRPLSGARS